MTYSLPLVPLFQRSSGAQGPAEAGGGPLPLHLRPGGAVRPLHRHPLGGLPPTGDGEAPEGHKGVGLRHLPGGSAGRRHRLPPPPPEGPRVGHALMDRGGGRGVEERERETINV